MGSFNLARSSDDDADLVLPALVLGICFPAAAQETDGGHPAPRPGRNLDGTACSSTASPASWAMERWVRYGSLYGVPVYVEPGAMRSAEVVYVALTLDGSFQPYQYMRGDGCGG
jgi:hypothetical protein